MKILVPYLAAALLSCLPAVAQDLVPVSVGTLSSVSDAALYIAHSKGWFQEEGLAVTLTPFDSAARMVAPLGAGQLDVGAGSASAGLYNAIARGIEIRIVADKASSQPGYGGTKLLVRKDLVDNGTYKTFADLAGLTIGMNAPGVSNTATLNAALLSAGLKYTNVKTVDMPFAQHVIALQNKAIDASATIEPAATIAIQQGFAVAVGKDDELLPNHQIAVLLYSDKFSQNKTEALAFMRAYLRGVRYYNDALADGHFAGKAAADVIDIIGKYTPFKDAEILRQITPTGMNPDGTVYTDTLISDYEFYKSQGLIEGDIDFTKLVDMSFANEAAQQLGAYVPAS